MQNPFKNPIQTLVNDLKEAEKILSEYSGEYMSAEGFHQNLKARISELENGNEAVLEDLWIWFAPTCQWDNFVGDAEWGERIFQQIIALKK